MKKTGKKQKHPMDRVKSISDKALMELKRAGIGDCVIIGEIDGIGCWFSNCGEHSEYGLLALRVDMIEKDNGYVDG